MNWKDEWKALASLIAVFLAFFYLPVGIPRFDNAVMESLYLARWYAREHVLLCLAPAFFIAGAIAVFVSQASVMKYLGARTDKVLAYGVASVSGSILAVCSCTVLPLFSGIWKMGAGLGPATAFLYSGPAINVLAIILTARILGVELGVARAVGAILAAISFIGRRVGNIRAVLFSGLFYAAGRILAYLAVAVIIVAGALSIPVLSIFLQRYMVRILGPVLIIAGMFLLELLTATLPGPGIRETMQRLGEKGSIWSSGLLGFLFALSFCPVSAALFFGSLIPLAVSHESVILLPSLYGIGTGLPVCAFAVVIAVSAKSVGVVFNKLTVFELWARRVTGAVFIVVGLYLSLKYIFNVL